MGRLLLALTISVVALAQEQPAFRADVALVHVDVEVTDGTRILDGFKKEDFVVKDNSKPQKVLFFSQDQEALDIILIFDISGSMRTNVAKVAASAHTALAELHSNDRIAVMTFNNRSHLVADFTDDRDAVERTLNGVVDGRFGGGTRILAAVDSAAEHFRAQPRSGRRRAVLIVTDDFGQRSRRPGTVIGKLWEADALLSGLIVRNAATSAIHAVSAATNPLVLAMQEGIRGVSEKTGGDVLKEDDPGEAFREMMRRIRLRYSLYYAMPEAKPGEKREVKVELSPEALARNPQSRVRARKGYIVAR